MDATSLALHDANCTVGRFPNHSRGIADMEGMAEALGELGITRALVRHALGRRASPEEANTVLAEMIGEDERWTPCWTLNPAQMPDGLAELGTKARAVCLYPKLHGYPLCDWMVQESLAPLASRGVLALIELDQVSLPDVYAFCQAFPGLRVVVLNTGYRVPGAELATLANYRGIETLAQRHGADRLLFGTNTPLSDGIGPLAALRYAAVSESERALIAGENLTRLIAEVRP